MSKTRRHKMGTKLFGTWKGKLVQGTYVGYERGAWDREMVKLSLRREMHQGSEVWAGGESIPLDDLKDAMTEDQYWDRETHRTHCCVLHRCKYSDVNCPVVRRKVKQSGICERCDEEGIKKIPDPDAPNYDLYGMNERKLRREVIRLRTLLKESRFQQAILKLRTPRRKRK